MAVKSCVPAISLFTRLTCPALLISKTDLVDPAELLHHNIVLTIKAAHLGCFSLVAASRISLDIFANKN
jgi:hypothetical protein